MSAAASANVRAASEVEVRRLTASDMPSLAPLFEEYRAFYGAPAALASARAFLRDRLGNGESVIFGAARGSSPRLVGFAQVYPSYSSIQLRRIAILNDLFVAAEWRRSGLGRRLVARVIEYGAHVRASYVELATQHTNEPARTLYSSIGFVPDTEFERLTLRLPLQGAGRTDGER